MTSKVNPRTMSWLLAAGLAFGAAATQAAPGYTVTQGEASKIAVGMSADEIQQTLGHPADIEKYRNEAGPTWTYEVLGAPFGTTDFDIDFGPDGKAASVSERVLGNS